MRLLNYNSNLCWMCTHAGKNLIKGVDNISLNQDLAQERRKHGHIHPYHHFVLYYHYIKLVILPGGNPSFISSHFIVSLSVSSGTMISEPLSPSKQSPNTLSLSSSSFHHHNFQQFHKSCRKVSISRGNEDISVNGYKGP